MPRVTVDRVTINLRMESVRTMVEKEFKNVQELAAYLKENPDIGSMVGYTVKKK